MSTEKVPQNATPSTRGTIYHLCVAVDKCYDLREGQTLLIEELGDVSIEGDQQVEVKQYSDNLTDGHPNFWKTLKNWMDDSFDHTSYTALILHTTQEFGSEATIAEWNNADANRRLEILLSINQKFESAYQTVTDANPMKEISTVLKYQRRVLDSQRRTKLSALIGKVWIEAMAKQLPDLYEELKQNRIRGVLKGKKEDFLNSLIGFVCCSDKKAGERWEITYEEFEKKIGDLNATYNNETRLFPRKYFGTRDSADSSATRDDLFIQKIRDIEYSEMICKAIYDFEATLSTINQEFGEYRVDPQTVAGYACEIKNRFMADYRSSCRNCSNELTDSKNLYDRTTASPAQALPGFGDTPDGFRNGLMHQHMNDPDAGLKWKLNRQ